LARYHVTIVGDDPAKMAALVAEHGISVLPPTKRETPEGHAVSAIATPDEIRRLTAAGYIVQRHEDVDKAAKATLKDVGRGNRYLATPPARRSKR
jgi:carboxypeptidase T